MKRSLIIAGLLVVIGAGALDAGAKVRASHSTRIDDPKGDSTPGRADIASITAVVAAGKITWTVTTYNSFTKYTAPCVAARSLHPAGLKWGICRLSSGAAPPCYTDVSSSKPYRAGGGCAGPATIVISGRKSVAYTVPLSMFTGRWKPAPGAIQWRAETRALKGCYPTPCDATTWERTGLLGRG